MKYNYLSLLSKHNITPNFWISEEYFNKAGFEEGETQSRWTFIYDPSQNYILFPPINIKGELLPSIQCIGTIFGMENKIWSDFKNWKPEGQNQFLDFEFVYNPIDFQKMEGGKWKIFRKNIKKFPTRFNYPLSYINTTSSNWEFKEKLDFLMIDWLSGFRESNEIHDDELLMKYLYNGQNRKILTDEKGELYGINIWDENHYFINFRYAICRRIPFLSEYIRYLFYTDPEIFGKGKLVNDGGILDNPSLGRFKTKLNPTQVREVKTWYEERR